MRKPIIVANWKMHKTQKEVDVYIEELQQQSLPDTVEQVICAPFPFLSQLNEKIQGLPVNVGAQNVHFELQGAYTGEVSVPMLFSLGVRYVILGHSERRHLFVESDEMIHSKIKTAVNGGLLPFFCIGETLSDREEGRTENILRKQLQIGLNALTHEEISRIVIAYEPVWAIGTGRAMSASEAQNQIADIRQVIEDLTDDTIASHIRIQYGGSVNKSNIKEFVTCPDIDGALIGGASLKADDYADMIRAVSEVKEIR